MDYKALVKDTRARCFDIIWGTVLDGRECKDILSASTASQRAERDRERWHKLEAVVRKQRDDGLILGYARESEDWEGMSGRAETFYVEDEAMDGQPFTTLPSAIDAFLARAASTPTPVAPSDA